MYNIIHDVPINEKLNQSFSSTRSAVTGFWYESTDAKGLVGELAVNTKAARHGGARGCGATLAEQAELEGSQSPPIATYC